MVPETERRRKKSLPFDRPLPLPDILLESTDMKIGSSSDMLLRRKNEGRIGKEGEKRKGKKMSPRLPFARSLQQDSSFFQLLEDVPLFLDSIRHLV